MTREQILLFLNPQPSPLNLPQIRLPTDDHRRVEVAGIGDQHEVVGRRFLIRGLRGEQVFPNARPCSFDQRSVLLLHEVVELLLSQRQLGGEAAIVGRVVRRREQR